MVVVVVAAALIPQISSVPRLLWWMCRCRCWVACRGVSSKAGVGSWLGRLRGDCPSRGGATAGGGTAAPLSSGVVRVCRPPSLVFYGFVFFSLLGLENVVVVLRGSVFTVYGGRSRQGKYGAEQHAGTSGWEGRLPALEKRVFSNMVVARQVCLLSAVSGLCCTCLLLTPLHDGAWQGCWNSMYSLWDFDGGAGCRLCLREASRWFFSIARRNP